MWATFFVTDEEGHAIPPAGTVPVGTPVTGGPTQSAAGLANLMSGRTTFGVKKRRRTKSTGHTMSEAQEGKVTVLIPCQCVFFLRLSESILQLMEPIYHTVTFPPNSDLSTGQQEEKELPKQ